MSFRGPEHVGNACGSAESESSCLRRHGGNAHDIGKSFFRQEVTDDNDKAHKTGGKKYGCPGNTGGRYFFEKCRGIALGSQTMEHTGITVQTAVVSRAYGSNHDCI